MFDQYLTSFIELREPWWVYTLAFLLPLCVLLCFREMWCWFFKINKLINRLERVEKAINDSDAAIPLKQAPAAPISEKRTGPTEL